MTSESGLHKKPKAGPREQPSDVLDRWPARVSALRDALHGFGPYFVFLVLTVAIVFSDKLDGDLTKIIIGGFMSYFFQRRA